MRSRLVLLVAIAALIVGALGAVDLFKSEPEPNTADEVVVEKAKNMWEFGLQLKPLKRACSQCTRCC